MQKNKLIIEQFYTAFSKLDYKTMLTCYSDDVVFNDPFFGLLSADETFAMWEMLCNKAQNFTLTYTNIELLDDEYATCQWRAQYIFYATGNVVTNNIKAYMRLKDGKIIEHSDAFSLYNWSKQAFGLKGFLLGWTGWFKNKVRRNALKALHRYMQTKQL
jgi:ketosteroid isomerase-like protein